MAKNRLMQDLNYLSLTWQDDEFDKKRLLHFCGRLSLAFEFNMITLDEFKHISDKVSLLVNGQ